MEEQGVVTQSQRHVIVPGGAHRADFAHALHRLVHGQHPGNAPLSGGLVDKIRLGDPQLGQSLLQVVEHHRHRPVLRDVLPAALPGERIPIEGFWFGLRFRGQDGDGGLRRGGLLWGLLFGGAGGEGEGQGGGKQQGGQTGIQGHGDSSLLVRGAPINCGGASPPAGGPDGKLEAVPLKP